MFLLFVLSLIPRAVPCFFCFFTTSRFTAWGWPIQTKSFKCIFFYKPNNAPQQVKLHSHTSAPRSQDEFNGVFCCHQFQAEKNASLPSHLFTIFLICFEFSFISAALQGLIVTKGAQWNKARACRIDIQGALIESVSAHTFIWLHKHLTLKIQRGSVNIFPTRENENKEAEEHVLCRLSHRHELLWNIRVW